MGAELTGNWNSFLERFSPSQQDIYYREEYLKLYQSLDEQAVCFVYTDGNFCFLFPYLLRSFYFDGVCYHDFETAYGYGGPIFNTDNKEFISKAWKSFYCYGQENHYIAGFVRFHPLLNNALSFDSIGVVVKDRNTIAIDLQKDIDSVWMEEIHTKNRNIIKRGAKTGLRFIADYQYEYLDEFIRLYNSTMDKLSADSFYHFDDSYYYQLKKNIPDSFLGVVLLEDKVISSSIFFCSGDYGHYHLSGSDKESLKLYPNNFMLWEAAKEMKAHGILKFHLGGGTNSDEYNSLYEFKKKFSKSFYSFQIGKIIFNKYVYDKMCRNWELNNPNKSMHYINHLLKYKY